VTGKKSFSGLDPNGGSIQEKSLPQKLNGRTKGTYLLMGCEICKDDWYPRKRLKKSAEKSAKEKERRRVFFILCPEKIITSASGRRNATGRVKKHNVGGKKEKGRNFNLGSAFA